MLVRPTRKFPGTAFYLRGSALFAVTPVLIALIGYATVVEWLLEGNQLTHFTLTPLPFTLVGLALSIFLGFRNNACYDRWWEARKLWGAQINTTRNITRLFLNLVRSEADPEGAQALQRELVYRIIAYTHALKLWLRDHNDRLPTQLEGLLPADELAALPGETNIPNAIIQGTGDRLAAAYDLGWIHPMHLPLLQQALSQFLDIQGGCERIKNTPVPLSYTMLTHRIVALYCIALPFGIHDSVGHLTPVVVAFVAFAFLGLDAVGTQIEDPFEEDPDDLPLNALANTIERNLRQRLGETDLPARLEPVDGILS